MTSEERKKGRYERRKAARLIKRKRRFPNADNYNMVFAFNNLWRSYKNCRKNVTWKGSVQRFIFTAPIRVNRTFRKLNSGTYKHVTPHQWDTYERGKKRHIKSVPIGERVVQRCLADNTLVPVLSSTFIYDNGACMQNKGFTFAINRMERHLHEHYRKYGSEGYILMYDFSKFYENVDHNLIRYILNRIFSDSRNLRMVDKILEASGKGLGLGSQISQILALASANALDHKVKETMRIKGSARYNDDGYLIHKSKKYLKKCLRYMEKLCSVLHITLNKRKTQIIKLTHGFKFLKVRFYLTDTGKIIKKIGKKNITSERKKLKKLHIKLDNSQIDWQHIKMQYQSWISWNTNFNAYRTIRNMDKLFNTVYHDELKCDTENMKSRLLEYKNKLGKGISYSYIKKKYSSWRKWIYPINPRLAKQTDITFVRLFEHNLNEETRRITDYISNPTFDYRKWRRWMLPLIPEHVYEVDSLYEKLNLEVAA